MVRQGCPQAVPVHAYQRCKRRKRKEIPFQEANAKYSKENARYARAKNFYQDLGRNAADKIGSAFKASKFRKAIQNRIAAARVPARNARPTGQRPRGYAQARALERITAPPAAASTTSLLAANDLRRSARLAGKKR